MAHTLEFLIILASMTSMVLRFGSGMEECTEERCPKVIDDELQCNYEIRTVMSFEGPPHNVVRRDSQQNVYTHMPSTTLRRRLILKLVNCSKHSEDMDEITINWEYECEVAAVANRVVSENYFATSRIYQFEHKRMDETVLSLYCTNKIATLFYLWRHTKFSWQPKLQPRIVEIKPEQCQIYIFTRMERWERHYMIPDNVREHFKSPAPYWNLTDSNILKDLRTTAVRNFSRPIFERLICTSLNEEFSKPLNQPEKNLPLPLKLTINDAVDNSLARFHENVVRDRAENIELKNISFSVYVSQGDTTHHINFIGGIFKGFSKIKRVRDAVATIEPHVHHIRSTFTMRQASVHFNSYHFPSGKVPFNDTISFGIRDARIELEHLGFWDSGVCNESVWLNFTRMSGITFKPSRVQSMRFSKSRTSSPTHEVEMKEILGPYLMRHLLRYGSADYADNIRGPCMPSSSKEWREEYSSKTDYHFIL